MGMDEGTADEDANDANDANDGNDGMGMDAAADRMDAVADTGADAGADEGMGMNDEGGMGMDSADGAREGQAAGLASARGSAAKNPVAYAASGVGVVIFAAIIIAAATRYGLKSDRAPGSDVEEGFPLNNPGVHPIYA
jgi:hypothetical protein